MFLEAQNILFLTRTMNLGGTENVILQLCEIFIPLVNNIVVCSRGGVNEKLLNEMGIKHYQIPDFQEKNPVNMVRTYQIIRSIVVKEHITVIHSHHRMAAFYAELLFDRKVIKLANAHNTFTDKKYLTYFAYRHTHVIAVGEKVKENLINYYGLPEDRVTVIHNAIRPFEVKKVVPVKELQNAKEQGYVCIGNIGRLTEQKGMSFFIEAASKVYKKCSNVRFYIVGDGEERQKLEKMAKEQLPKGVINFLGYRTDVQNIMSQMDFIVLSSLWEGFPLTPIEAFSVSKPVVATAVDGTIEIIKDHNNGLLVKSKDVDGLADAMTEMIDNDTKRKEFGKAAYKSYVSEYSFEKMAQRYIVYYKRIKK